MKTDCHFIPFWKENPYQLLLADALRHEGFVVAKATKLSVLQRTATRNDIVHLHWLPSFSISPRRLRNTLLYVRQLFRLKKKGTAIVWTAHNLVPHETLFPGLDLWLTRIVGKLSDRVICHSAAARDEVIFRLKLADPAKVKVIPHGHYIDSYPNRTPRSVCREQLGLERDDVVFLFLGTIRPYKGVIELVDAFRRISAKNAKLVIAGKPNTSKLDAQLKELIQDDTRIIYHPTFVADDDMQLYFNAADIVTFPYQKSLTSGALILAMSFGRASLAPRLPGMIDCLAETGGFFYDTSQRDGLFHALTTAIAQRDALSAMGNRNMERAQTWDWRSIANQTAACYKEALEVAQPK